MKIAEHKKFRYYITIPFIVVISLVIAGLVYFIAYSKMNSTKIELSYQLDQVQYMVERLIKEEVFFIDHFMHVIQENSILLQAWSDHDQVKLEQTAESVFKNLTKHSPNAHLYFYALDKELVISFCHLSHKNQMTSKFSLEHTRQNLTSASGFEFRSNHDYILSVVHPLMIQKKNCRLHRNSY